MVIGILLLTLEYPADLKPRLNESLWTLWQVVLDQSVKFRQVVAWNSCEHVVLGVVVHVPVKEPKNRVQFECSTTYAEVWVFIDKSDMLSGIAQELYSRAKKASETDSDADRPVTGCDAYDCYEQMSGEDYACPSMQSGAHFGLFLGE